MTRSELLSRLEETAEPGYRDFSLKLLPGTGKILGVRLPQLHKIAVQIANDEPLTFLDAPCGEFFEERMVRGLVIAHMKLPPAEKLMLVRDFLPLIDNWSVCDSFCAALKDAGKEQEIFLPLIEKSLSSADCFTVRFSLVMLTDWYLNDQYIDSVLKYFFAFSHPEYYARMAAAWGISIAFVKYPDKTMEYLKQSRLDPFTHNTAIRKICESKRPSEEQKELVRGLKRKN
ncbi:MAG: DNA alkylation repair protein [Oscillospiraceae bacterium]|nr:DNA alkylation repair protein [Oscillospiraceae bacterium]